LPQNEVETIKQELIGLMIAAPPNIQAQLGETISVIAESDFWEGWQTLVDVSFSSIEVKHTEQ
jgi:exportin-2 (importin alpha re-exporter)